MDSCTRNSLNFFLPNRPPTGAFTVYAKRPCNHQNIVTISQVVFGFCQNLRNCRLGGRRVRQHSWQYTGRPSVGLKGTSHSSPQSEHTALCIVRGLRSRLTQLNTFSPRFHCYDEKIKFS